MQRAALASLLFLSMLLTPAHAQRDTTARLSGTVRSSINGLPVSGVMIAVKGSRVFNVSDSTGSFTLVGLPGGRQTVRILYGDSLSDEKEMDLKQGKTLTLSVLLDVAATELAPIVVEAQTLSAERSLAGFYERKKSGFGRYYTLADLKRCRPAAARTPVPAQPCRAPGAGNRRMTRCRRDCSRAGSPNGFRPPRRTPCRRGAWSRRAPRFRPR